MSPAPGSSLLGDDCLCQPNIEGEWFRDAAGALRNKACPHHGGPERLAEAEELGAFNDLLRAAEAADPTQPAPRLVNAGVRPTPEELARRNALLRQFETGLRLGFEADHEWGRLESEAVK